MAAVQLTSTRNDEVHRCGCTQPECLWRWRVYVLGVCVGAKELCGLRRRQSSRRAATPIIEQCPKGFGPQDKARGHFFPPNLKNPDTVSSSRSSTILAPPAFARQLTR